MGQVPGHWYFRMPSAFFTIRSFASCHGAVGFKTASDFFSFLTLDFSRHNGSASRLYKDWFQVVHVLQLEG